ncbi:MAG: site-specific DNA-methyltransferase [Candidatus Tokpelaia sp.]|nr:MAG: site-specific DNA-methyltransferase [Candidatus Tokpelaia sp.]KAA6205401.1 MAG: site-specific DNA-methyltransferase [Candidatus Tokpelaia sp.]
MKTRLWTINFAAFKRIQGYNMRNNFDEFINEVICGDSAVILKKIPDKSIDCIITSPPYDNLRDYKGFTFIFENIATEICRVLKDGGVLIWIVGDATIGGSETLTSFKQALYFQSLGLNCHDTMIYQKNNFSNPSRTRYHQIFEYMFIFSRGAPKTFNPIIDRKNVYVGYSSLGENTARKADGSFSTNRKRTIGEYGMRYNIWKGNTAGQENMCKHLSHPAQFPLWLAKDHILSWTKENDIVLDPFCGSGTTGCACKELKRRFIGIEIEDTYCQIARERIKNHKYQYESALQLPLE